MVVMCGEKYRVAAVPFRIYSTLLLVRITGYGTMLLAFGRSKEVMRIQIFGMAVNVGLSFLLLPRIGMIAAPLGAVLTQVFMIIAILGRVDSHAHLGFRGIFPWSHWLRTLGAATLAAAFTYGVTFFAKGFSAPALLILSLIAFAPLMCYLLTSSVFSRKKIERLSCAGYDSNHFVRPRLRPISLQLLKTTDRFLAPCPTL